MKRALAAAAPLAARLDTTLLCRIDREDVEAMLDAYDSGMCDTSTANCISRAIARLLSSDRAFPLIRYTDDLGEIEIDGHRVPVPKELLHWLQSAELGGQAGPIEFALQLPASLARETGLGVPAVPRRKRPATFDSRTLPHHSPQAIA
jgi:hypothetical protein